MRKAAGKRMPHGATSDLVIAVLWCLHMHTGRPEPVSRDELVRAVPLPETTVDDRLRVLVKQGKAMKLARGLYAPVHQEIGALSGRYWRHRPPPNWKPSPKDALDKIARQVQPPGAKTVLHYPEGVVMVEQWFSLAEYSRIESERQHRAYLGRIPAMDDADI